MCSRSRHTARTPTRLLQVLAVARDPLSLPQLSQLGLEDYLELLPGWGTLYHERGFKVGG